MGYRLTALLLLLPVLLWGGCSNDDNKTTNPISHNQHRLTLTSPNGGESWISGSHHDIAWTDSNVTEATVLFSADDGVNWTTLTAATTANSFAWTVPAAPSTSCRIKVMDAADSTVWDMSDSAFTVVYPHDLHLVTPNGGEVWNGGSVQAISWTGHNVGSVHVLFSPDSGAHWTVETAAIADTIFQWPVPTTPSARCLMKVVDAADSTVFDVSDSVFTVTYLRDIVVHTPNGGETWTEGSVQHITWTDLNVTLATVQLSADNGVHWTTLTDSTADTSYAWTVGAIASESCLIKVFDCADSTVFDISDSTFTLAVVRSILVTSPNGGESWRTGSSREITWTDEHVSAATVQFSTDNGSNWTTLIGATSANNYLWTIPGTSAAMCLIKVMDAADSTVYDVSDAPFSLADSVIVTVLAPNGGESWMMGSSQSITWTGLDGSSARIFFSADNGASWNLITDNASDGIYGWTVPATLSTQCRVRVEDAADSVVNDISDGVFTINSGSDAASHSYSSTTGGTFSTPGGARMTVPVGAVPLTNLGTTGTMVFSIERSSDVTVNPPTGETQLGNVYQFGPEGFVLARPVEVALPIPGTSDPGQVKIWRLNPTTQQPEYYGCAYDPSTRTVRAQTYQFSPWFATTSAANNTSSGCLNVTNNTGRWLSLCVENVVLEFAEQAEFVPELGQGVVFAPLGTIGWTNGGHWYLPQGVYDLCVQYEEPAGSGTYVHGLFSGISVSDPWSSSDPVCTDLGVNLLPSAEPGGCVCVPEATTSVGTGDIQVTLTWHSDAALDLDLWVMDPDSEWCYYGNGQAPSTTTSGGQLDRDNLCANYINGRPENIYWTTTPPAGEYIVGVDWYSDCGNGLLSMPITVRTVVQGLTQTFSAVITPESSSTGPMEVTRFQIVGSRVRFLPPRTMVTYPNLPTTRKAKTDR